MGRIPAGLHRRHTNHKYLPQLHENQEEEGRKSVKHPSVTKGYVLKSQLSGKNKIHTIDVYTLPVLGYLASIVSWTKHDIETDTVKSQKCLTMYRGFQPKSNTQRQYSTPARNRMVE